MNIVKSRRSIFSDQKMMESISVKHFIGNDSRMVFSLLLILFLLFLVKFYLAKRHFLELASRIPDPQYVPFLGTAVSFIGKSIDGELVITLGCVTCNI